MRYAILLTVLLLTQLVHAQETYTVDGFSDKYFGKVHIEQPSEVFSPGWVAIYDKKTKKQLVKVNSEELTKSEHEGKVVANVKELPYGEQSSIMHEDYNFDGKKDFAIMDGQNSCYHGPSFRIYLATATGLAYSSSFTKLAQEKCGMFDVDPETKHLTTMTKSGCCWHEFSEYIVASNVPVPIKVVEESVNPNGIMLNYSEQNRVRGKMMTVEYNVLMVDELAEKVLFSFDLGNEKKMRIVNSDGLVSYVFTGAKDKIELIYNEKFEFLKDTNTLTFKNGKTRYSISSDGVVIESPKLNRTLKPEAGSVKGSLSTLATAKIENVTVK